MPHPDSVLSTQRQQTEELLNGTILRVTFQNAETGYRVLKAKPERPIPSPRGGPDGLVTLVGALPGAEVGELFEAGGTWEQNSKYGMQFRARWFKPTLPSGAKGIEAYLASGAIPGIGPVMAQRIVEKFGERTFEILDTTPDRLREVPKIGGKTLDRIKQGWGEARGDRALITFLGEHGISPSISARLARQYGQNALAIVRANPYRLAGEVRGIGFHRADAIARRLGLPADAVERIDAGLIHALQSGADDGHTCLPRANLEASATELLDVPLERVRDAIDAMVMNKRLAAEIFEDEPTLFLPILHQAERRVAAALLHLTQARKRLPPVDAVGVLADFEQRTRFRLADAQREAALALARQGMLILTGGPGTGKTTTVRAIIELFNAGRLRVKLAAPTGRAARRLSETSKLPAETIHRLLGFQAHQGGFSRDAANPIEEDLVIVDEVSMLDTLLAASLFEAIDSGTCLLLVGDEDQLPSVGPGNVLGDLIATRAIPPARLTEIFRQARTSRIVTNAHRINRGLMPQIDPPGPEEETDFYFIERETPEQIIETIRTLVSERIPNRFGLDPRRDIQVLAPMRRGELGVEALNQALKTLLNPSHSSPEIVEPERRGRGLEFSIGDRVMQVANDYDKLVFNGDIGRVTHMNPSTGEVHVDFDGRGVSFLRDELDSLTLAYAITIHKSQGSEYPAVILPLHAQHWIMLQRNLLYTALTRARRLVCLVGTKRALRRAVANATRARRWTGLARFLKQQTGIEGQKSCPSPDAPI